MFPMSRGFRTQCSKTQGGSRGVHPRIYSGDIRAACSFLLVLSAAVIVVNSSELHGFLREHVIRYHSPRLVTSFELAVVIYIGYPGVMLLSLRFLCL